MDNFTLAVVVGDVVMALAFVALIVFDKKKPPAPAPIEAVKPAAVKAAPVKPGKR